MDDFDPNSLLVDQAVEQIQQHIEAVNGFERVALRTALGRILFKDVLATMDVPGHTNSAMDGYAINSAQLADQEIQTLEVAGTAWAGRPFTGTLNDGQCVRIMTGAPMPHGTDTVIIQEQVRKTDNRIEFESGVQAGQNVRQAGEDIAVNQVVLQSGRKLTPADLGLLASLGIGEVTVFRKLRVAFFSTGDELRSIGEPLEPGALYDSNRYTLFAMLHRLGVEPIDMGVIRDRREDTFNAFKQAAECADVIITSGGVSVGEADFVKECLDELGQINFWKVAMKPGRPLAFWSD